MNTGDDESRSISSVSSTGATTAGNNRSRFLAARDRASSLQRERDSLQRDLATSNADLQEARIEIRLLKYQLDQSQHAVCSLLNRLNGEQSADASRSRQTAAPAAGPAAPAPTTSAPPIAAPQQLPDLPAVPQFPASPPQAFAVHNRSPPPILPDPHPRRVIHHPSARPFDYVDPAPRLEKPSINARLGPPADLRGLSRRDRLPASTERSSGPRGYQRSTAPPTPAGTLHLVFPEGTAGRRPPN